MSGSRVAGGGRKSAVLQEHVFLDFLDHSQNHCVGVVDIVDSTRITSELSESQTGEFYSIFLGIMDACVRGFGGTTVKNMGDALLFSFPDPPYQGAGGAVFKNAMECCMAMIGAYGQMRAIFREKSLRPVRYRISAAYGPVRVAKLSAGTTDDIFGYTVNRCAKLNRLAPENGVVIDEQLYENVRALGGYRFRKIGSKHGFGGYVACRERQHAVSRAPARNLARADRAGATFC